MHKYMSVLKTSSPLPNYSCGILEVNSRGAGTKEEIDHYSYPIPKNNNHRALGLG